MENMNDVVETTENTVEQPVEENVEGIELTDTADKEKEEVKTYTEEELNSRVNELLGKKIARERRKIEREYESKYADYMDIGDIVSKGLNAKDIKEAKSKVKSFYENQGITFEKNRHSDKEERILGRSDAEDIIELGFDDMQDEANRLASVGYDNLSIRDKEKFNVLANALTKEKNKKELKDMGVKEEILNDSKFKEFAEQFNSKTSIKNIYELYKQTQPKKEVRTIGSMKGVNNMEKEYYTEEELNRLTLDELSDDRVWEKALKSMRKK